MKKKPVLTLDPDLAMPDYEGFAFLLFHTEAPSYVFVDDLNRLYGFALTRTEDMQLHEACWPMFTYYDPKLRLHHYLVERPAGSGSAAWPGGHKLLIVRGDAATNVVESIHEEFSAAPPPVDPTDLLAQEHNRLLENFHESFTLTTHIDPTADTSTLSRKAQREQAELFALLNDILDYFDIHRVG